MILIGEVESICLGHPRISLVGSVFLILICGGIKVGRSGAIFCGFFILFCSVYVVDIDVLNIVGKRGIWALIYMDDMLNLGMILIF